MSINPNNANAQLPFPNECDNCCYCNDNSCEEATGGTGFTYCVSGNFDCGFAGNTCIGEDPE